jgi:hypothetical protein
LDFRKKLPAVSLTPLMCRMLLLWGFMDGFGFESLPFGVAENDGIDGNV